MWFVPLGTQPGRDDVAELAASPLTMEMPNLEVITNIAPLNQRVLRLASDAAQAGAGRFITASGGNVNFDSGYKIHQFTSVGSATLVFALGPRGT